MKKRRQQGILTGMPFMANLAPRTFVDDLGRKIFLAEPPARIVSLAPSITEMLFALGLGEQIVGVTFFCNYPPEAQAKPKVGYSQPNLETIVTLRPDLVLAPSEYAPTDVLSKLEQLKIPTFVLVPRTIEDIASHVHTLGRMLARTGPADQLATNLRRRIGAVKAKVQGHPRPRLLYVLNSEPLITVGPGSYIHQMIELAGGTNVAEHATAPYPRLTTEVVLQADPEIILFPVGSAEGIPESEQQLWRRWPTVTAVKRGRLHRIDSDLVNRPGPRAVDGLERLAQLLHPEMFPASVGAPQP
jgi:iron complex transport system substrate-binding protein